MGAPLSPERLAMPPSLGAARAAVQEPLVRYATEIGWAYLPPEEALTLRRGEGGTLCYLTHWQQVSGNERLQSCSGRRNQFPPR